MNITKTACAALALLVGGVSAHAFTIDLSGQTADGAGFNTFIVNNASMDSVGSIEFAFVYDAGDNGSNISWGSELVVQVGHLPTETFVQIGTQAGSCDAFGLICDFDLMWDDVEGIYSAAGTINLAAAIADGSGDWEILIADQFDDAGIDGRFLDGSYITLNQVPVPAAVWFMGSALLSLFGVRRMRKR